MRTAARLRRRQLEAGNAVGTLAGNTTMTQILLGLDPARVNVRGGAIALGHPLGASGARLATTAINRLHTTGGRYALCTMCIGVGQGIAMVVENLRS